MGTDCKELRATAHDQYLLFIDYAEQLPVVRETSDQNPIPQVRFFNRIHM